MRLLIQKIKIILYVLFKIAHPFFSTNIPTFLTWEVEPLDRYSLSDNTFCLWILTNSKINSELTANDQCKRFWKERRRSVKKLKVSRSEKMKWSFDLQTTIRSETARKKLNRRIEILVRCLVPDEALKKKIVKTLEDPKPLKTKKTGLSYLQYLVGFWFD